PSRAANADDAAQLGARHRGRNARLARRADGEAGDRGQARRVGGVDSHRVRRGGRPRHAAVGSVEEADRRRRPRALRAGGALRGGRAWTGLLVLEGAAAARAGHEAGDRAARGTCEGAVERPRAAAARPATPDSPPAVPAPRPSNNAPGGSVLRTSAAPADKPEAGPATRAPVNAPLPALLKDAVPRVTAILVSRDRRFATVEG